MTRLRTLILTALLLGASHPAIAGPDFYGVKMKSEDFARNVVLHENHRTPDFSNDRPGTDKRVYAYAYTSSFLGRGRGLSITVHNHSDDPIRTERLFRECVILTNDGKRIERSQPEMEWRRDQLGPGEQATFNMAFPGVDIRSQDIRMIIFSFGMGETKIFLFPMVPAAVSAAPAAKESAPPAKKVKPAKAPKAKAPQKSAAAPDAPAAAAEEPPHDEAAHAAMAAKCFAPIKIAQTFLRDVGEMIGDATHTRSKAAKGAAAQAETEEEYVEEEVPETEAPAVPQGLPAVVTPYSADVNMPVAYPEYQDYKNAPQVIEGVTYNFRPDFRGAVKKAETETVERVTKDRLWSIDNPDQTLQRDWAYQRSSGVLPRETAKVVLVNPNSVFLVFDAGREDGVRPNSIVSVLRDGRRVGKAMTSKVRDRITAALILPEWRTKDQIQAGDTVSLSS